MIQNLPKTALSLTGFEISDFSIPTKSLNSSNNIMNKWVIITFFIFVWPWRRGPKSNLNTSEYSQSMISCSLLSHPKPLGPIISKLWVFLSVAILVCANSNLTTSEDSQPMISCRLVLNPKPLEPTICEFQALLCVAILISPWRKGPRWNLTTLEDSHHMISNRLDSHLKTLGLMISEL